MRALVVTVPAGEVELASDALWSLGATAIEERDARLAATSDDLVELWTALGDDTAAIAPALDGLPDRWRWRFVEVDATIAESWRHHAVPTWISKDLVIVPAWRTLVPPAGPGVRAVSIDPGAAFGLGDHPTTMASLRILRRLQWPGASVLDVGCGSGVLGIVAALHGAPRVVAVDVAQAAIEATRANARRNGVDAVLDAERTPVAELDEPFDLVLANILAPTLVALSGDLARLTAPGGVLIVSGLLEQRTAHVLDALAPMREVDRQTGRGWAAIALRH